MFCMHRTQGLKDSRTQAVFRMKFAVYAWLHFANFILNQNWNGSDDQ